MTEKPETRLTVNEKALIRAELGVRRYNVPRLMAELNRSRSAINQALSGYSRSAEIQGFVSDVIGRWPWPWERGSRRKRQSLKA